MKVIEKYDKPFEYAGILLNLIVADQFYHIWSSPQDSGAARVYTLTLLMVFECALVHSGVLMASIRKKFAFIIMVPFYGFFAYILSRNLEDQSILILYLFIVLNRIRFAFMDVPDSIKRRTIAKSALVASFFFIMLLVFMIFKPALPRLGLTNDFLKNIGYFDLNHKSIFFSTPHTVIGFGFVYYCFLVLVEALFVNRKFDENSIVNIPD